MSIVVISFVMLCGRRWPRPVSVQNPLLRHMPL